MIEIKIKKHFEKAGIALSDKQNKLFAVFYRLITEHNDDNDLTRIHGEDNFIIKHFIDSVYYTRYISLPDSIIDIGTGAGFPGIPIKIMNPRIHLILAEQRSRRVEFLKHAVAELGLAGVEFYPHKVTGKSFFNVNGVITRALEDASETLDRVEHFLPPGGVVILLKGPDAAGDMQSLSERNKNNYTVEVEKNYILPGTEYSRKILMFRKKSEIFRKIYQIMKNEDETQGVAITSSENKTFRELKKIVHGEWSRKSGLFLIAGKKIITDYISETDITDQKLLLPDEYIENNTGFNSIISLFHEKGLLFILKKSLYNELNVSGSKIPVIIASLPEMVQWDGTVSRGCTPVIPFQDPVNVGTAVRSSLAFGINSIILTSDAANPFHPKAVRASSGAVFKIKFLKGPHLEDVLKTAERSGVSILSLDKNGESIYDITYPDTFIIITGREGKGLPETLKGKCVSVPVTDRIESLNASVALSVFLYDYSRKKKLTRDF